MLFGKTPDRLELDVHPLPPALRVGTSSFSSDDWRGVFYPEGARPGEYLRHYAGQLNTVEIDATFYAIPSARTVDGWREKTPEGFTFAAKIPRRITHEGYLEGCEADLSAFLSVMDRLGDRLGPLLFQFPYVAKRRDAHEYETGEDFRRRLAAFLPALPTDHAFVVEVRNEKWLRPELFEILARHDVGLALVDYFTMPSPAAMLERVGVLPGRVGYVRFLGDHRRMDRLVEEAMTAGTRQREWDSLIVDRTAQLKAAVPPLQSILETGKEIYIYFNNHYAGFGPGSIELFVRLWREATGQQELPDKV